MINSISHCSSTYSRLISSVVIHNITSSTSGAVEIPLLQGLTPPIAEEPNRGTIEYSKPSVAIFLGALYSNEEINKMRQVYRGVSSVPWLKIDITVSKPPLGPGYAEHVVQIIKERMKKIKAEGKLE